MIDPTAMPQHATIVAPVADAAAIELPLVDYDAHAASYIVAALRGLSQRELRTIDHHECSHLNRAEIRDRVAELACEEPWIGYDGQDPKVVRQFVRKASSSQAREVEAYERAHRNRGDIVQATVTRLSSKPA